MWISFGGEDIGAELRLINERLDRLDRTLTRIERKQGQIMALVAIEQGDLDTIAITITQVAETLQAVLDSETPLSPADESGVQEALTKLQAVGPRVPADAPLVNPPADPAPVDVPAVTDPAAGDAVVTDPAAGDTPVTDPAATDSPSPSETRFGSRNR